MSGVSVASSPSRGLDALMSRYTCIQESLPAADASRSDSIGRYPTLLRVFRSREVDEPQPPLLASFSNPTVHQDIIDPQRITDKVAAAIKALSFREPRVLVQFWSPVAVQKRCLLTTLDQPFGLGVVDEGLYLYRLDSEQRMHVVDEEHQEELGPLARVYCHKLPEWALDINDISVGQHLQDRAASHNIHGYVYLPVFEPSSGCCVGVLELITSSNYVDYAFEVQQVSRALKEENLKSPNVLEDTCFCAHDGDEKRQLELDKIFHALKIVCVTHNLPLAQTWGPCGYSSVVASSGNLMMSCSSFSKNCIGKVCISTATLPFYVRDLSKWGFHEACGKRHLDKSQGVVGRSLSSRGLCFCGDVSQLSDEEYPLVPYARMHGITSCLAIYFKSIQLDDEYVVELFLPTQSENGEDIQSLVKTVTQLIKKTSRIQLGDMSCILDISGIPLNWNVEEFSTLTEDLHPLARNEKNDFDVDVVISKKQSEFAYVEDVNPSNSAAGTNQNVVVPYFDVLIEDFDFITGKRRGKCVDCSNKPVRKRKITDVSIGLEEICKHFGKTMEEAAHSLGVSRSTLKRICRRYHIPRWPYSSSTCNATNQMDLSYLEMVISDTSETDYANITDQWLVTNTSMENVCDNFTAENINLLKEDREAKRDSDAVASKVNVRFKDSIVQFTFLLSDGLSVLENEVANWFKIEGRRACLKYKDEDGDLILICVDDDLKSALDTSSGMNLICEPNDM